MVGVYESQPRHYSAPSRSLSLATIHEVERPPLSPPPRILRRSNTSQHIQPPPHYRPARLPESHQLSFDSTRSNTSRYRAPVDAALQPPLIPYGTRRVLNQDAVSESDASCDSYEYVAKKCLESSPGTKSEGPDAHQEVTDQTGLGIYTPEEQLVLQRADSIRRRHGIPRSDDRGRQTQDDAYTGTKFRQKSTDAQISRRSTAPELGTNVLRARALPAKELPRLPHSGTWKADKYVTKQYHNLDVQVPTSKVTLSACSSNGQGGESPILGFGITERIRESENHITKSVGQRFQDSTLKSRKTSCQTNEELDHRRASSKTTCKVSAGINESHSTDQYPYEWYDDLSWTVDESSGIIPPHAQHGFKLSRGSKRNISHHHTTLTYLSERSLHGGSRHGVDRDRMEAEGRAKWDQVEAAWEATKAAGNAPIHDFMPALSGKKEKSKGEKKEKQARRVNSQPTLKDEDVPPRSSSSGKTSQDSKTVWMSEPILNSQNPYSEAASLHGRNTTGSSSQTRQNSSPTRHHKRPSTSASFHRPTSQLHRIIEESPSVTALKPTPAVAILSSHLSPNSSERKGTLPTPARTPGKLRRMFSRLSLRSDSSHSRHASAATGEGRGEREKARWESVNIFRGFYSPLASAYTKAKKKSLEAKENFHGRNRE